jgi:hypothetical protein
VVLIAGRSSTIPLRARRPQGFSIYPLLTIK